MEKHIDDEVPINILEKNLIRNLNENNINNYKKYIETKYDNYKKIPDDQRNSYDNLLHKHNYVKER